MDTITLSRFDPFSRMLPDPYPAYREYRAQDPVHWGLPAFPGLEGSWYVFRHAECSAMLAHKNIGCIPLAEKREIEQQPELIQRRSMLFSDPPHSTRLRSFVKMAFTPRIVENLVPRITAITNELLDAAEPREEMDVISDFAFVLPLFMILDILGVPRSDHMSLRKWSAPIMRGVDIRASENSESFTYEHMVAGIEFVRYFQDLIAERRKAPRKDLLSNLIAVDIQGDKLTLEEIVRMCILLVTAGHETVTDFIGNALLALMRNPDQMKLLQEQPDVIDSAVDELMRYDTPVQLANRYASDDISVGDKLIRRGDNVVVLLGSANRDPAVFHDPEALDIRRRDHRILSFGQGVHYCLGSTIARAQGRIAISAVMQRMPNIHLREEFLTWHKTYAFRGLANLPVAF